MLYEKDNCEKDIKRKILICELSISRLNGAISYYTRMNNEEEIGKLEIKIEQEKIEMNKYKESYPEYFI